jgi:hypothetical protein
MSSKKGAEDERTRHMSAEALGCRAGAHSFPPLLSALVGAKPSPSAPGAVRVTRSCIGDCGTDKVQEFNIRSRELVSSKLIYASDGSYLMPGGSGRMLRAEALDVLMSRIWTSK